MVTFSPELNLCCVVTYAAVGNGAVVPAAVVPGVGVPGVGVPGAVVPGAGVPVVAEVQVHDEFRAQSQKRSLKVCAAGVVMVILGAALTGTGSKIIIATGHGTVMAGLIVTVTGSIKYVVS